MKFPYFVILTFIFIQSTIVWGIGIPNSYEMHELLGLAPGVILQVYLSFCVLSDLAYLIQLRHTASNQLESADIKIVFGVKSLAKFSADAGYLMVYKPLSPAFLFQALSGRHTLIAPPSTIKIDRQVSVTTIELGDGKAPKMFPLLAIKFNLGDNADISNGDSEFNYLLNQYKETL